MARRLGRWIAALRFLNVLEPGRFALSPRKVAVWVAIALAVYSTIAGRDNALLSLLTMITGG
jgi:hypothetical protein